VSVVLKVGGVAVDATSWVSHALERHCTSGARVELGLRQVKAVALKVGGVAVDATSWASPNLAPLMQCRSSAQLATSWASTPPRATACA